MTTPDPEPFEVAVDRDGLADLRHRLERTRWPAEVPDAGWEFGVDLGYLRGLCDFWSTEYEPARLARLLNRFANWRWQGLHLIWERAERRGADAGPAVPVCLIHGWPGAPIEFIEMIPRLLEAGHDVVVPSLPGFGFSEQPARPLNCAAVAERLRALMHEGLGYERYAVQGGDWGSLIAARLAHDAPAQVVALHLNSPSVLPLPASLDLPPLTSAEQEWLAEAQRWRMREGFHLFVQGAAPDALAPALADSPAGLAAWLVEKYRRWSDCGGEVERRFSKEQLCDFLTLYWITGSIASSMRIYAAEARERWRFAPGERIAVPAAVAEFPAEILRPPREWSERQLADLRRWTPMPRGGHFAAFEEPELLATDLLSFLDEID